MVRNLTELEQLQIFRQIENALPHMAEFRRKLLEAAGDELKTESRPPVISVFHLWTFWVRCQLETRKWFALL